VERELLRQFLVCAYRRDYQALVELCPTLRRFETSEALLEHLHNTRFASTNGFCADAIFRELLEAKTRFPQIAVVDDLFVLAFVPAIHGTLRQLFKRHAAMPMEDAGQHAVLSLLEFLGSGQLEGRESHFAFAISRRIKRSLFEWAEREMRQKFEDGEKSSFEPAEESFERYTVLRHFLATSVAKNWLEPAELDLLIQFKLEGSSGTELGEPEGISGNALRQRVKRLVRKLRRLAQVRNGNGPALSL